ncbi:KamA family radical SAM protein [Candidatus Protochlamydia phocaeensis]|uniref:KamA family radical SAM protein n=1 Tax=Candidatus Protochlamydia phocaeensis TaxID=1414722 RepID=UPI000838AD13|nr:KamA family radical SAM protein [Candidatus Protochlamydia phocaeensis]
MSCPIPLITPAPWRAILRENFNRVEALADFLELSSQQRQQLLFKPTFAINVPLRLAQKMAKQNLDDPLVRQFLPTRQENENHPDFVLDPVQDETFRCEAKLLHKYEGRVLLVCTSACAMHCRYCFRQNFSYDREDKLFLAEIEAIRSDASIHEVILSGGDPLSLSDETLKSLLDQLNAIPHLKRLRFHTRFPIGIPERIDDSFLRLISACSKQLFFVIHCNHPKELGADLFARLKELQKLGCVLLNQAVLLKGVNDDAPTLRTLCEELADQGILPYYLHQLDRVQGTAHFEVEEEQGRALIREIARSLPGYAVPKYVREIAGEPHKTPLN